MPPKRLPMRYLREILRLRHAGSLARDSPNYAALLAERIVESVDASPASRARTGCMPSSC